MKARLLLATVAVFLSSIIFGQETANVSQALPTIDIKGTIVNPEREPLEGITVTVKGSKIATSTNKKGEFSLPNLPENATLIFTGTNIETFETKVEGRKTLELTAGLKIGQLADVAV